MLIITATHICFYATSALDYIQSNLLSLLPATPMLNPLTSSSSQHQLTIPLSVIVDISATANSEVKIVDHGDNETIFMLKGMTVAVDYAQRASDTLNAIIDLDLNDSIIEAVMKRKKQVRLDNAPQENAMVEELYGRKETSGGRTSGYGGEVIEDIKVKSNEQESKIVVSSEQAGYPNPSSTVFLSADLPIKKNKSSGLKANTISAKLAALRNEGIRR